MENWEKKTKQVKAIKMILVSDYEECWNKANFKGFAECCHVCGKGIKELKYYVNTIEAPMVIPSDITHEDLNKLGLYSQGTFPIGSECRKKYPKEYVGKYK